MKRVGDTDLYQFWDWKAYAVRMIVKLLVKYQATPSINYK